MRWELLGHPSTGVTLGTSETTLLSRWMSSDDWRPVRLRAKAVVRALAAVSAPTPASLQRLQDLTARISELQHLPLLVVLASCQSAGDGEQGVGASTVECQPRLHQRALTRPRRRVEMIDDLSLVQVQRPDGGFEGERGSFIEPVYLQVVGHRLWAVMPAEALSIDAEDVARYGEVTGRCRTRNGGPATPTIYSRGLPRRRRGRDGERGVEAQHR